jgi:cysteinyl-tRNA synthetase
MFRGRSEYSQFDADGVPTHTSDGAEISKSARKKLEKERTAQEKLYQQYLAAPAAGAAQ